MSYRFEKPTNKNEQKQNFFPDIFTRSSELLYYHSNIYQGAKLSINMLKLRTFEKPYESY